MFCAIEAHTADLHRVALAHEILLKAELRGRSLHPRFHALIAHDQDLAFDAEAPSDICVCFRQGRALGQKLRSKKMGRQVAVAELEPGRLAQLPHDLETFEGICFHAPTAFPAESSGKRVQDGIHVGRNVQAPPAQVVASVDDVSHLLRRNDLPQPLNKLRSASAAGENRNHAALRARPPGSAAWRRRSAIAPPRTNAAGMNSG